MLQAPDEDSPFFKTDAERAEIDALRGEVMELRQMLLTTMETVRLLANAENHRIERRKKHDDQKPVG